MITAISTVIALFIYIFNVFKWFFLLCFVLLVSYIIIKEIKNRKYSRNPFKRQKETTDLEYIIMMINNSKHYKKYIVNNDYIILIIENGIYFIKILDYKNKIKCKIEDKYVTEYVGLKEYKLKNKLIDYNVEYSKIKRKIDYNIKKYVVTRNDCNLYINDKSINVINSKNFYFEIDNNNKVLTHDQIDDIYNKLV